MLTNITGIDTLDITTNESPKLQCTFRSDYWDDSAEATPEVFGPIYMDSKGDEVYAEQTTKATVLTKTGEEGGNNGTTTKSSTFTNSVDPER